VTDAAGARGPILRPVCSPARGPDRLLCEGSIPSPRCRHHGGQRRSSGAAGCAFRSGRDLGRFL